MACFHPLSAFARVSGQTGSLKIAFSPPGDPLQLPCGQCIGCRLDRSLQWACRCMHEASLYDDNCFITLTYDDDNLPVDGSLDKSHFQKFMKRLRKRFRGRSIRYYHCGEYGDKFGRPHYHACLFNFDFTDKELFSVRKGVRLYTSGVLSDLWKFGVSSVGDLTFESAAYVARYCLKKKNGADAEYYYERIDEDTGEILFLEPEYTTMSRRPGIGHSWFSEFSSDVFPWDEVIVRGRVSKPPRYYDSKYEIMDPDGFAEMKEKRKQKALRMAKDNTPSRLHAREVVKLAQVKMLKRGYEEDEN